ncbi:hypothetical protein NQ317_011595 [Molorchus minor]|uniref:Uncharacterized protein n=1 Tax=Molorchus minor TaxID=1323400 RepID=A0ABQ9JFP0_9CUCU|nr:hypothetical protein NQ317_011595 [Molorchus minor]
MYSSHFVVLILTNTSVFGVLHCVVSLFSALKWLDDVKSVKYWILSTVNFPPQLPKIPAEDEYACLVDQVLQSVEKEVNLILFSPLHP